jgi:hypothetical protein
MQPKKQISFTALIQFKLDLQVESKLSSYVTLTSVQTTIISAIQFSRNDREIREVFGVNPIQNVWKNETLKVGKQFFYKS